MQIKETSSVATFDNFFGMSNDDIRLSIYERTLKEDEKTLMFILVGQRLFQIKL